MPVSAVAALLLLGSPQVATDYVKAKLVSEVAAIAPGKAFRVAVAFDIAEHWHTYWRNPGDSGLPTRLTWKLPAGFQASEIAWPAPQAFVTPAGVNFGYERQAWHIVTITPPADLQPGKAFALGAKVTFLVCREECLPGTLDVALELPAAGEPLEHAEGRESIEAASRSLPRFAEGWKAVVERTKQGFRLTVTAHEDLPEKLRFFSSDADVIEPDPVSRVKVDGGRAVFELRKAEYRTNAVQELRGVLVSEEGDVLDPRTGARAITIRAAMPKS